MQPSDLKRSILPSSASLLSTFSIMTPSISRPVLYTVSAASSTNVSTLMSTVTEETKAIEEGNGVTWEENGAIGEENRAIGEENGAIGEENGAIGEE